MPEGPGEGPCFSSSGPSGAVDPRRAASQVRPGRRGSVDQEGCPATVAKDIPLWEPLPTPSPQLCRGSANGKRKLGQRKWRQGAPPEKPDKKAIPPSLPGRRGPGTGLPGSLPLALAAQCASRPPDYLPPSPSFAQGSSRSSPLPDHQRMFLRPRPAVPAPCAPGCAHGSGDAATPALLPHSPRQRLDPPPSDQRLNLGAGAPGEAGIPTRQKATPFIGRQGGSGGQGTAGGAGRDPGGAGPKGRGRTRRVGCLPGPLRSRRAHPLPLAGLDAYRRAEFRVVADRASRRETVSGRQFGLAQPRKDDPGRQAKRMRAQNTGLASTERGRQEEETEREAERKQSQTERGSETETERFRQQERGRDQTEIERGRENQRQG